MSAGDARRTQGEGTTRRRWVRWVLVGAGVLVVLIGVGLIALPWIVAGMLPSRVAAAAAGQIDGSVDVERVNLSWFGAQHVGPVVVRDDQGVEAARLEVDVDRGLLGLATNWKDLGTVRVSGEATVEVDASGRSNIERILRLEPGKKGAPAGGEPKAEPARLPEGLSGKVVIDGVRVTYVDPALQERIGAGVEAASVLLDGTGSFETGQDASLQLTGKAGVGGRADATARDAGAFTIDATIAGLTDSAGRMQASQASVDGTIEVQGLAIGVIDSVLGQDGKLVGAIGSELDSTIDVSGSMQGATATVRATAPALQASLDATWRDKQVTLTSPATIAWDPKGLGDWVATSLAERTQEAITFDTLGRVNVSIDALTVGLDPARAGMLDLRGGVLNAHVDLGAIAGTVRAPGSEEIQRFDAASTQIVLETQDLAKRLGVTATTGATVADRPAGYVDAKVELVGLADAQGSPQGLEAVDGTLTIAEVPTLLLQPLTDAIDFARDVGPTMTLKASAQGTPGGETTFDVSLASRNVGASGSLAYGEGVLSARSPVTMSIKEGGGALAQMLADAPVRVSRLSSIDVTIDSLRVDVNELDTKGAQAMSMAGRAKVGTAAGTLVREGETPLAWALAPTGADMSLDGGEAKVTVASNGSTFGGQSLGAVEATGTGVFGTETWSPSRVGVDVTVTGLQTAAIEAFVPAGTLEPEVDLGPTLDLHVLADVAQASRDGSASLTATSERLDLSTDVRLAGGVVTTTGGGIKGQLRRVGQLAGRLVGTDAEWAIAPPGFVTINGSNLRVSLKPDSWSPDLDTLRGSLVVSANGLGANATSASSSVRTVVVESLRLTTTLGASSRVEIAGTAKADDAPFTIEGGFEQAGTLGRVLSLASTPGKLRPVGSLTIKDAPVAALAGMAPRGESSLDFGELAEVLIGPKMEASVATTAQGESMRLDASVRGQFTQVSAGGQVSAGSLSVDPVKANMTMPPARQARLLRALGQEDGPAKPTEQLIASLTTEAWQAPLDDSSMPDLAKAGAIKATISMSGGAALRMADEVTGNVREVGPLSLRNVTATLQAPGAALAAEGPGGKAHGVVTAEVLEGGKQVGSLNATADATIASRKVAGLDLSLKGVNVQTGWLDAFAGEGGLISGAIGPSVSVELATNLSPSEGDALERGEIHANVSSDRLTLAKPAVIRVLPNRFVLAEALDATWKASPAWVNEHALKPEEGETGPQLVNDTTVKLVVNSLVVSREGGPFSPGRFNAAASLTSPRLDVKVDESTMASYSDIDVRAKSLDAPDQIGVTVRLRQAGENVDTELIKIDGLVDDFTDDSGEFLKDRMAITADAILMGTRTDVVDALLERDGLLEELLGPTVDVKAHVDRYTRAGGTVQVTASSERADASLDGVVGFDEFVAKKPVEITVKVIRPELAKRMVTGLPLVGTFEKRTEDGPALVRATNLRLPLDGDYSVMSGDVHVDLGEARFQTSGAFSKILSVASQSQGQMVGHRLQPLDVRIRKGVISYDKYTIPLGEFQIQTEAKSIDLVNRKLDILTWIPLGALGDEAAGQFNSGLGSALGRALPALDKLTRVPWRTKGSFESPLTTPDVELFMREFGGNLLRPDKLFEDRLKQIFGGGGDKKEGGK